MIESNRRDFLIAGAGALATMAVAGAAMGQESKPAAGSADGHANFFRGLVPGAVDADGKWTLPPLPYDYAALEPHIDEATMRLHHGKHHAAYVAGLIKAEENLAKLRESGDFTGVDHWSNQASFHGGGHFLHTIFWDCMGPNAGGEPAGSLAAAITRDFGSFTAFKGQFSAASKTVEGSGWGILGFQPASGRLTILQGRNQQLLSQWALLPLLCLDVWEHAYYLKYQNKRADYVDAWWNVVDWKRVGKRFDLLMGVA